MQNETGHCIITYLQADFIYALDYAACYMRPSCQAQVHIEDNSPYQFASVYQMENINTRSLKKVTKKQQ